jgi:two-component system chemotaxis response regulator CheB
VPKKHHPSRQFHRDIVVIGGSAGAVEALISMARDFPKMCASIFVVLHSSPRGFSMLPSVLDRHSPNLNVESAQDGLEIRPGSVYVAVPDHHLVIEKGYMRLVRGPVENRHRPAIDSLFRSAARAYGSRVIGVVLSGYLDDGSAGMHSIKKAGGLTVVQDPADALAPWMPESAINTTRIDYIRPVVEIPALLGELVQQTVQQEVVNVAPKSKQHHEEPQQVVDPKGTPSAYTCPECNGTLWEVEEGKLLRYACRVGHSFSIESMVQDQGDAAERAVWAALRALEERADLSRRMANRSRNGGLQELAARYSELAESAENHAAVLRRTLMENRPMQTAERGDDLAKSA